MQAGPAKEANATRNPAQRIRREGLAWLVANLTVVRVGGTITTILLRRLLGPATSGVFDLAVTPYRFFDSLRNFGVGPVLIYEPRLTRTAADTAWTFNVAFAFLLALVANIFASLIAVYFGHPGVERLLRILSIGYVLAAAGSVHGFLLLRELDLRARSIPSVGQIMIGCTAAIIAAVWTTGSGPLVLRELSTVGLGTVLLWLVCPYLPRLRLDHEVLWRQLRYSSWIGAGLTSLYVAQNADVFVAGHVIHSAADVGFYTTSWRLAVIVAGLVSITVATVVFPALSRTAHDPVLFHTTLVTALRQSALVVLPASVFMATLAPVLIVPLLGAKWAPYRGDWVVIAVLALYNGGRTLSGIFFEGYKATGRPWLMCVYNVIKAAVLIPAMVIAAPHGIRAVALVYMPVLVIELPLAVMLAERVLAIPLDDIWKAIRIPCLATVLSALFVLAGERWLVAGIHTGDLRTVLACGLLAVTVYWFAIRLLAPDMLREARTIMVGGLLPTATPDNRTRRT